MVDLNKTRLGTIWTLSKKAFGGYKKEIFALLFLGFLGGILEGIGINAIIPLFSFLDGSYAKSTDLVSRAIRGTFEIMHLPYTLKFLLIFMASLFLFKAVAMFYSRYITESIQASYIKNTRLKLFRKTLGASWPYLSKQKIGYLDKVITNDIDIGSSLLNQIANVTILLVNISIYAVIAFGLAPTATLLTIGTGAVLFFFFKPIVYKMKMIALRKLDLMKIGANHIDESMLGIKTIKAMSLEDKVLEKASIIFDEWRNLSVRFSYLGNFANVAMQPASVLVVLGLFAYTYKTGDFSFASFAIIIYAINKIFAYIQQAQIQIQNINGQYPYLKAVLDFEDEAVSHLESKVGGAKFAFDNKLSVENLSFEYKEGKETLTGISLQIPKGKIVGIIGPSGSGKTTFVDLLLRLIKPTSGKIMLDTQDINEIDMKEWRDNIGYVAQDNFLINDTIKNNICFYSNDISEGNMIEAAKLANIYDFIKTLDKGFDSEIGERGMAISGGQRQRIALARVLARKPKILVLDEATSALDNESQALIQKAIENLRGSITVIVIAHRPSAVMNVDELVVLENGKVSEKGVPEEMLANQNSYFHKMVYSY